MLAAFAIGPYWLIASGVAQEFLPPTPTPAPLTQGFQMHTVIGQGDCVFRTATYVGRIPTDGYGVTYEYTPPTDGRASFAIYIDGDTQAKQAFRTWAQQSVEQKRAIAFRGALVYRYKDGDASVVETSPGSFVKRKPGGAVALEAGADTRIRIESSSGTWSFKVTPPAGTPTSEVVHREILDIENYPQARRWYCAELP